MKKRQAIVSVLLTLFILITDQWIKVAVKTGMYMYERIHVTDWFYILFTENRGMAFGLELMDKYLARIQQIRCKKVKGDELTILCKTLSQKTEIRFAKKFTLSKTRMLQWLAKNNDAIEPVFEEILQEWATKT